MFSGSLWPALAVFALAVLVRGGYLYESSDNPTFCVPVEDSLVYDQMARELVAGGAVTSRFFWQPFFYPFFLSVVYRLSNSSILWAGVLQVILGGLTCLLVYRLGEKILGRRAGILAGIIAAVYMPLVFYEAQLLATGWAAFWSVALVLLLVKAREKLRLWNCVILGLCSGFSVITRPVFLPFIVGACVWLAAGWIRQRLSLGKQALALVSVAIGFGIVAGPMAVLSYRVTGKARLLPSSGGLNFYIGNNPNYKEIITAIRPGRGWRKLTGLAVKHGYKDPDERERFFRDKTIDYALQSPWSFMKGLGYKTAQFFNSREMPRSLDIYVFRKWSWMLRAGVWKAGAFGFPFVVLLPLAVVGGWHWRQRMPGPLWLFLMFYAAAIILVTVSARYRMPVMGVLSVLAAGGCVGLRKVLQKRQWIRLAVLAGVLVAAGLASAAVRQFYIEQVDYEPQLYYGVGDSHAACGRLDDAITAYDKTVALSPDYVEAHHKLGLLLANQDRRQEAMEHYYEVLRLEPANADVLNRLGNALVEIGMIEDAITYFKRVLQARSVDKANTLIAHAMAHNNLGNALTSQGRFPEAIKHYQLSLQARPKPIVHYNLGNTLARQGRYAEAIRHYELSLEGQPANAVVLNNLGKCLEALGRPIEALERYRQAKSLENKRRAPAAEPLDGPAP